jgi:hypothetical protein
MPRIICTEKIKLADKIITELISFPSLRDVLDGWMKHQIGENLKFEAPLANFLTVSRALLGSTHIITWDA